MVKVHLSFCFVILGGVKYGTMGGKGPGLFFDKKWESVVLNVISYVFKLT